MGQLPAARSRRLPVFLDRRSRDDQENHVQRYRHARAPFRHFRHRSSCTAWPPGANISTHVGESQFRIDRASSGRACRAPDDYFCSARAVVRSSNFGSGIFDGARLKAHVSTSAAQFYLLSQGNVKNRFVRQAIVRVPRWVSHETVFFRSGRPTRLGIRLSGTRVSKQGTGLPDGGTHCSRSGA